MNNIDRLGWEGRGQNTGLKQEAAYTRRITKIKQQQQRKQKKNISHYWDNLGGNHLLFNENRMKFKL